MAWLSVTTEQRDALSSLNAGSPSVRVNAIKGAAGGWIVSADALTDAVPGGPLKHFATWYESLTPSDDVPAPRPPRPRR
jgi:hypothetical protein